MSEQPTCKTCKFFDLFVVRNGRGRCLRFPPQLPGFQAYADYQTHEIGIFPLVEVDSWCGEHKPKETQNEQ